MDLQATAPSDGQTADVAEPRVWIVSPPVSLEAESTVEITGWVRVDQPFSTPGEGLAIIDSLGGPELSLVVGETSGWQMFRMVRAVPQPAELRLTFALTGVGSAKVDAVMVRTLQQPVARRLPAVPGSSSRRHAEHRRDSRPYVGRAENAIMATNATLSERDIRRTQFSLTVSMAMQASAEKLRADVERIWRAGVAAVLPERLVPEHVRVDGDWLVVGDDSIDLRRIERIAIVGAGKAAGAMAIALENVFGPQLLAEKNVVGWINVPADCVAPAQRIHLHAARPAGVNEPRPEGVEGTRHILEIVASLGPT